jgi:hypothetical protein
VYRLPLAVVSLILSFGFMRMDPFHFSLARGLVFFLVLFRSLILPCGLRSFLVIFIGRDASSMILFVTSSFLLSHAARVARWKLTLICVNALFINICLHFCVSQLI